MVFYLKNLQIQGYLDIPGAMSATWPFTSDHNKQQDPFQIGACESLLYL